MRIKLLFLCMILAIAGNASTARYRVMFNTSPSNAVTIGWDQVSGTTPIVYYGTTDLGTNWASYPNQKSLDRAVTHRNMNNNFARLTGLLPNTAYYFVIKDSEGTSIRMWFKTCPNDLSSLCFISGGDSRNNRTPRVKGNVLVSKIKPHAVFFGGDAINSDSDANNEWIDWMNDWQSTRATDGRMFPIVMTRGNHEAAGTMDKLFDVGVNEYFGLTFGNNLFRCYTLNTELAISSTSTQTTWLNSDLTTNSSVIWKAAQFHKPMRPHESAKSEGTSQYAAWAQMFYDKDVKLVMDSDSHCVKTTWPVKPSTAPGNDEGFEEDANGTVFIGEGCWGAPLRPADDNKSWTRNSGSFNEFKLIFVSTTSIEIRTVEIDNSDSAASNTNTDPFQIPTGLSLWNPSNGSVIYINKIVLGPAPEIEFEAFSTFKCYENGSNVNHRVNQTLNGCTLTNVKFYVDNILVSTDTTAPFEYTSNYTFGSHNITIVATATDGRTDSVTKDFFVGFSTQTLTFPIVAGDDDVEEAGTDGNLYTNSSDLELVNDGATYGYQKIGLRFSGIKIPYGAIVTSAYIQFTVDEVNSNPCTLSLQAEKSANAKEYTESVFYDVSSRDYYNSTIAWSPPAWPTIDEAGVNQRTPSIVSLIQDVVNNPEWESGNAIGIKIAATGSSLTTSTNKRIADSFEGGSAKAPKLVVEFSYACCGALTTNWNGSSWSNGIPNKITEAIISGNLNSNTDIEACSIAINNNAIVNINNGNTLTVVNELNIDNGATLNINNNAGLLQIDKSIVNISNINVFRNSSPMVRLDYTGWSSPVSNQQLKAFSPNTLDNRFYRYEPTGTTTGTAYISVDPFTNFTSGKGYLIRSANNWPATLTPFNGKFTGSPFNGDITTPLGIGYNLIGNPYPTPINATAFFDKNTSIGTIYFWNHISTAVGGTYQQNNFASKTKLTAVAAQSGGQIPNDYIQVGQGFYVNSTKTDNAVFSNSIKEKASNSTQFFRSNETNSNIETTTLAEGFRLSLTNATNDFNQIYIGYSPIATNEYDFSVDGDLFEANSESKIYSVLPNKKLVIQGRNYPFNNSDIVPLGLSITENIQHQIKLDDFAGLFNSQNIYIKDNLLNTIHNLKLAPYSFITEVGTFENRLEIIYTNSLLSTEDFNSTFDLVAYTENNSIQIKANNETISQVTIYDVVGRKLVDKKINDLNQTEISNLTKSSQTLLLVIKTTSNKIKKIKLIF